MSSFSLPLMRLSDFAQMETKDAPEPKPGTMQVRLLICDDKGKQEVYRIRLDYIQARGRGWCFIKESDGTVYSIEEQKNGVASNFFCSCPGGRRFGMKCRGGSGCKHIASFRALRRMIEMF